MKSRSILILGVLSAILLSACGAIPTLPPPDSTIAVSTVVITLVPGDIVSTESLEKPLEATVTEESVEDNQTQEIEDTATAEPLPSATPPPPEPTNTPVNISTSLPANTSTPLPTSAPTEVPYALQKLNPYYLANFTHPEDGCNWMGVGGQVFNSEGKVQKEIIIRAGGSINGNPVVEEMTMPQTEPEIDLAYGPGGFEITLADGVAETDGEAWIQLFSLGGDPLSEKVFLVTFDDCLKNLILMNFSEK